MRYQPDAVANRWVAYFDLLGTRELLASGRELQVVLAYQQAVEELTEHNDWADKIRGAWFSDTFILVAPDDSGESFSLLEALARRFAYFLLRADIPLRGAIACDRLYADFAEGVFVGSALVEAYEYGDGQDWIGLLLCPSAMSRMKDLSIPAEDRLNYAICTVPWKRRPSDAPDRLAACILGNWIQINGENQCLENLQGMMARAGSEPVRKKYERTIEFIERHARRLGP